MYLEIKKQSNRYEDVSAFLRVAWLCIGLSVVAIAGCATGHEYGDTGTTVISGAERLFSDHYHLVVSRRVGLVTNHSAIVGMQHLADRLHADPSIELVALFGPEHGIRGTADAGEPVDHGVDERTGVPVYSLYGDIDRPAAEMLERVDVLIFDIQDVGARFYTYPATMGRAMQSAAEAGIQYLVLDRPNPIAGLPVEGHIREDRFRSGIGLYPTPITHGMTIGELALMIKGERWHEGVEDLDLRVVEMEGWTRGMLWPDTGMEWMAPSPNIPDVETAIVYPGTCFFEGTTASEGRGTFRPFLQVGSPCVDSNAVVDELNRRNLPGLAFRPVIFVPESIEEMSKQPKLLGEEVHGIHIEVTAPAKVRPVEAGIHILQAVYESLPAEARKMFFIERALNIRAGNEKVLDKLRQGDRVDRIVADWERDVERFKLEREPYLIYD